MRIINTKIIQRDFDMYAEIKVTTQHTCQSCGVGFDDIQVVFYAWLDNTIICRECTKAHAEAEPRLYVKGEGANE